MFCFLPSSSPPMSDSPTETATAILARLFRGSETDICTVWLDSAEDRLSDTSFHHLVTVYPLTLSVLPRPVTCMYIHFRTKMQMKLTPGRYWKDDPTGGLTQDTISLDDLPLDVTAHLTLLCTGSIGGILLVTCLFDANRPTLLNPLL